MKKIRQDVDDDLSIRVTARARRSPAFQFYPDKHQTHTRRLDDASYRVHHELICWMWLHSPDYCSLEASADAVATVLGMDQDRVAAALLQIQNPHCPLLKVVDGQFVSNGLRKESIKQEGWQKAGKAGADTRWKNKRRKRVEQSQCDRNTIALRSHCTPSPSPSPAPLEHTQQPTGSQTNDGTLIAMANTVRSCRPEYAHLNEMDLVNALRACPLEQRDQLAAAVERWCADQANALRPLDVPLASLRKQIAAVAGGTERRSRPRSERENEHDAIIRKARG